MVKSVIMAALVAGAIFAGWQARLDVYLLECVGAKGASAAKQIKLPTQRFSFPSAGGAWQK